MNNMPGIAGLVNIGGTVDTKSQLQQMLEEMKHEDFYVAESYSDPPFGIGRIHLDVERCCHQPIFSEDQEKCIVMIGEIYGNRNAPHDFDLATSEKKSKIILHLYSKHGLEFVNFINGSFSLAICDFKSKKLLIANDRYGLFPIYYAIFDDMFLFASEVKSILTLKSFPRILDHRSVADFFSFGYILGNKTFFNDIKLLPPACICLMDARKGGVDFKRYWDFNFVENNYSSLEHIAETVNLLLKISVNKRIPKKPESFGLGLSGGIDSRTILAHINTGSLDQIFAFTIGMKQGFDRKIAQNVCDKLRIPHHFFQLKAENLYKTAKKVVSLTDGMWIFHHSYGQYPLYRELKKHFDVVLMGTAGELFHGSYLPPDILNLDSDEKLTKMLYQTTNTLIPYDKQHKFFSRSYQNIVPCSYTDLQEEIVKAGDVSTANKWNYFFMQNRVRRFINLGIVHIRSFFECRLPFFDYDLMDYFITVPPHLRANNYVLQKIFSNHYPELGSIPLGRLGFYNIPLARHLVHSQLEVKIGLYLSGAWKKFSRTLQSISSAKLKFIDPHPIADIDYWYRTELRDFIENILLDSETLARPYFDHEYVMGLIRAHMTGKKNLADILGALVTFELWHRMFFDQ
jgi:asparagine synthase (glutamine-hydrolysing)